jgi:Ca2+-binding EF-hand superfamily protein
MAKLDADKDGRISRAESVAAEDRFATRFDEMDVNKDGYVDRADHEIRSKQRRDEWFASADTDKDGKLSRAEFDAAKTKRVERGGSRSPAPQSK